MWAAMKDLILAALQALYGVTGDYGFAIILLTIIFRVALVPLTLKQTRSMYEMQRIQPKIKELQQKYKNDKEKLQEETLKFYQDNKVNPFGGCLPMLLQMPIFIALFQVLGGTADKPGEFMRHLATLEPAAQEAAKAFWIILPDMTSSPSMVWTDVGIPGVIPYATLVALFGLSVWLPQQLMPGENQQKQIGILMAFMMLYFGWISPAGVLLYWVTSSLLGIVQQQLQLRYYSQKGEE